MQSFLENKGFFRVACLPEVNMHLRERRDRRQNTNYNVKKCERWNNHKTQNSIEVEFFIFDLLHESSNCIMGH